VTGSIIGLLGRADMNGVFHTEDYVYAGYYQSTFIPQSVNLTLKRSIFAENSERRLIALTSGLEIGLP